MSFAAALLRVWEEYSAVLTSSGYALFNIEAHVFSVIVLAILFNRQQNSSDQTEARVIWSRLLFVQILVCISQVVRVLADVDIIPDAHTSHYAIRAVHSALFGLMCWLVFVYIETFQQSGIVKTSARKFLTACPLFVLIVLSLFAGDLFPVVHLVYPLASVLLAVMRRRKMTRYERDTTPAAAIYPAFFVACVPVQALNWRMPFLCYVIVIADIFVYISYADSLVSIDPLTKIHNKNGLVRELSERLARGNPETLHVFALDVDNLNAVNASYGRTEGDRALVIIAGALKKLCEEEHPCYISRYYGDEFIITADIHDDEERELFTEHIRNYISNAATAKDLHYHIRVNIGWAKYEQFSRTETITGLIEEADRAMYEDKEKRRFAAMWNAGR